MATTDVGVQKGWSGGGEQPFCDLDPVKGGALPEVVAAREEQESIIVSRRSPDPPDQHLVASRGLEWRRVDAVRRIVTELHARCLLK
jgi:hypothetical protein